MKTVGITACSDAQNPACLKENQSLVDFLRESGCQVLVSRCIYEKTPMISGTGKERAEELMHMYRNPDITDIFDISGGDMANEVLPELDYKKIKASKAVFWGYSDLTTVLNAIYAKTGKAGVLYSLKNLYYPQCRELQRGRFLKKKDLFSPDFQMIQGKSMEGVVVGGNLRCFLKLAGTEYMPDLTDKLLLLEANSGRVPQMITYLSQLRAMGVFGKIRGILLGTFTQMEAEGCGPDMVTLVKSFAGSSLPIAKTAEIGHGPDSKAIWIGKNLRVP